MRKTTWLSAAVALMLFSAACGTPGGPEGPGSDAGSGGEEPGCVFPGYDPSDPSSSMDATPYGDGCDESVDDGDPLNDAVGCGPGPTPDGVTSWEECPDDEPSGPRYQLVEPQDGLVDPRPVDWLRATPRKGGTVLRITFWSGVEECYGVSEIITEESPAEVVVTIMEGRNPAAEVCIEIAVKKAVDVELSEPLGGRKVVDGAE